MNKLLKLWNRTTITIRILCIFILYTSLRFFFKPSYVENFTNPVSCNYYYMEQCGHCKTFSPEWDQFVQSYTGDVKLRKIEMNEAGKDLEKYKIEGFPTILFINDKGEAKNYDGPRTSEGLDKFLSNI